MSLYGLGYGIVYTAGWMALPFSNKLRRGYLDRRGLLERVTEARARMEAKPYWFHVASSGELEQAIPVMEEIKRTGAPVFLSYFSPTARDGVALEETRRKAAGVEAPWDASDYLTLDFPTAALSYVDALDPRCFVAVHREIWPAVVGACEKREVPCYLIAAHFSSSARRWFRAYAPRLSRFRFIGTVDEKTKAFLKGSLSVPVEALGDPRIERVHSRRKLAGKSGAESFLRGRPVFLFASLRPQDFEAVKPCLEMLITEYPQWRLLIVPHEPQEKFCAEIVAWLKARGAKARLWSRWLLEPETESHLVVNAVGFLAELYSLADLVFVGGSFTAKVHNVLEPAVYGKPILTGPFISNSLEASEMAEKDIGLFVTETPQALTTTARELLLSGEKREEAGRKLTAFMDSRRGASARYAHVLRSAE